MSSFATGFSEEIKPMGLTFRREVKPDAKICNPLAPSDLPPGFQVLLKDLSWVEFFIKSQSLKAEHATIETEIERLKAAPPARTAVMGRMKRDFDAHQAKRRELLKVLVADWGHGKPNVFEDEVTLEALKKSALPLAWEEIEAAAAELPEGISEEERRQKLSELNAQYDYGKCHPRSRYTISTHKVETSAPPGGSGANYRNETSKYDHWRGFVEEWRRMQANRCAPCDVLGFDLADADMDVKQAWATLKLGRYVNEDSPNLPARGNARQRFSSFFSN